MEPVEEEYLDALAAARQENEVVPEGDFDEQETAQEAFPEGFPISEEQEQVSLTTHISYFDKPFFSFFPSTLLVNNLVEKILMISCLKGLNKLTAIVSL